jgi:4-amino-4-deoxy-L-arabinose transferase-like glycosyltransferase
MKPDQLETQPNLYSRRGFLQKSSIFGFKNSTLILVLIIVLAAFLRFYHLAVVGDGNLYYTAAVKSMLQSWSNFFFVAAEPGGSVTVDKPPLGLWIQAAFAFVFGVSGFAVILPQILSGLASIVLLYQLVRRYSPEWVALLAALILAISPIAVAAERNNTMDAILVFTLLLAACAFLKAADEGRLRWLLLGTFLVGLGFNIKMLQAFLPLPAFYALYYFGSREGWFRKLINLAAASLLLLMVSFSWSLVVDLIPPDQRPYIGSSENNTVLELTFGHNGLNRLFGGGGSVANSGDGQQNGPDQGAGPGASQPPINPSRTIIQDGSATHGPAGQSPPVAQNGRPPQAGLGNRPNAEVGEPGLLRLFREPLSNEIAWLLPLSLLSIGLVVFSVPRRWPIAGELKAIVLWGGWLMTAGIFFSVAEFYHAYYLVMIAPPLAALTAMGIGVLVKRGRNQSVRAALIIVVVLSATLLFQLRIASSYIEFEAWMLLTFGFLILGAILIFISLASKRSSIKEWGLGLLVASILVTPLMWSLKTSQDASPHSGLPSAYAGEDESAGPRENRAAINQDLLDFLQRQTVEVEYLFAVRSSMEGASYVLETGRPVLYMGGFNGADPVVNVSDLAAMVSEGRLRYVLWSEGNREIGHWLRESCQAVDPVETGLSLSQAPEFGGNQTRPARITPEGVLFKCETKQG